MFPVKTQPWQRTVHFRQKEITQQSKLFHCQLKQRQISTRLLQRLGKGGIAVFRVRVLGTRVPFCANAIQRQSPFHHSPLTDLSIPSATTIKEQWCDEETEYDLVDAGIFTDQVHPAIGHGIMQRDTKKLRETIAALVDDKE